jgi:hypothetical protein
MAERVLFDRTHATRSGRRRGYVIVIEMLGKQAKDHVRHPRRQPWRLALALCCALLLIFGATVQVAHVHSAADVSHAGCALCATAHVVVSSVAPVAVPFAAKQATTPVVDLEPSFARRFLPFSLYTRPPPAAIAFA